MEKIKVSVIVPTYNRRELIKRQINTLLNQTISKNEYELIVVNDGSTDGTKEFLDACALAHSNVTCLHIANGGPARARNIALSQAKGNIIAFTDDDCEAAANWLEVILQNLKGEVIGLQGLTYTDRKNVTPVTHQIDNEKGHNSVPTCNAAYYRDLLIKIGGFDETFPHPHNEDADIGWQMQEIGEVRFCPDMRIYHPPRVDKFSKVAKRMRILESEFRLYEKNPELYRKHRDLNPLRHIYVRIFIQTMWYYTYSRVKFWKRPKLMFVGFALTFLWILDLIRSFPRYYALYKKLPTSDLKTIPS